VTPPVAPFDIPPIITYAVPGFVLLIIVEMIVVKLTKKGRYEYRDSATSLAMGFGNRVFGIAVGSLAVLAYVGVYQFRLFDLGWTWPVMAACFFAEDLAYYWFHRIAHERRFFWASHIVHHSSQHYNLTTALRQTWTGTLGLNFIFWLPMLYIGFPPLMVLMFSSISR
jgi:sterol desaturase/sphingolipid hydroxylase (fatty acid hydroxylase superfamily)